MHIYTQIIGFFLLILIGGEAIAQQEAPLLLSIKNLYTAVSSTTFIRKTTKTKANYIQPNP